MYGDEYRVGTLVCGFVEIDLGMVLRATYLGSFIIRVHVAERDVTHQVSFSYNKQSLIIHQVRVR